MSSISRSVAKGAAGMFFGALLIGSQTLGVLPAFAGAYLTLNSFSGTPGSSITVSGGGWNAGDTVNLFVGSTSGAPTTTVTIGSDSTFSTSVVIPANAVQGSLTITGVDTTNSYSTSNSYYVVPLSPTVTDSAASHAPYAVVPVTGSGFAPNEGITLALGGATASTTANATGAFSGTIVVPMTTSGLFHLIATGNSSGASSFDYFWIDTFYPSASPSVYYLMPGATLSFNGSGFAAGETIKVTQAGTSTPLSTFTTDNTGSFTSAGAFSVPVTDHGQTVTFTLTGQKSGQSSSANVTVGDYYAYVSPTSYYLLPGQSDTFTGGGFVAGEKVDVYAGSATTPESTITTDQTGSFMNAGSALVPFGSTGSLTFRFSGEQSMASTSASIAVGGFYPSLSPSSYYVTPGTSITIAGSGYAPSEGISLTVNGSATTTSATTTAMGTFSAPVLIPFSSTGSASIVATGNQSHAVGTIGVALAKFFPIVNPSSWFAYPGSQISYSGNGFVPGETVTVTQGSIATTTVADSFGTIHTATTTVPYTALGTFTSSFVGSLSANPTSITIAVGSLSPYLTADAYSANPGQVVHVQGFSFAPGETVHVTAGSFSTTTVADANGNTVPVAITTPFGASSVKVTFTGASSAATNSMSIGLLTFNALITSSSYYTLPGSTITITGSGFAPNEQVAVGDGTATTTVAATALGGFTAPITLPFTQAASAQVIAVGQQSGAVASLAVAYASFMPQVAPSTYYTLPGTAVTFTGTGYAPNEVVNVAFNGTAQTAVTASATGSFSYPFTIPYGSTHATVSFIGATSGVGVADTISLATFSAYISLSSYYGTSGQGETVTGSGFAPGETVTLAFNGVNYTTTTADKNGAIKVTANLPFSAPGNMPVTAVGSSSGAKAGTSVTVAPIYPSFMLGSYAGAPGDKVTFIGSGFLPNEVISVTTDRTGTTPVATFTTDASGSFNTAGYTLPTSFTGGTLVFTVTGSHSFIPESITYYVTGA